MSEVNRVSYKLEKWVIPAGLYKNRAGEFTHGAPSSDPTENYKRVFDELKLLRERNSEIRKKMTITNQKSFTFYVQKMEYKKSRGEGVSDRILGLAMEGAANSTRIAKLDKELAYWKALLPKHEHPKPFSYYMIKALANKVTEEQFNDCVKQAKEWQKQDQTTNEDRKNDIT